MTNDTPSSNILYVVSEVVPFAKTGGLADVASALPISLKSFGHDIRVFMPKYKTISERKFALRDVIRLRDLEIPHKDGTVTVSIRAAFLPNSKVQIYFLDYPPYFDRDGLYGDPKTGKDYKDNAARFSLFARSALEMLKKLHWQPEVIHCNDWQCGLIPIYLKTVYSNDNFYKNSRTLFTVHNFAYNGLFALKMLKETGLNYDLNNDDNPLKFFDKISFLKGGLELADYINTVSKTYAQEVLGNPELAAGMQDVLHKKSKRFVGILNGVNYDEWDPEIDPFLHVNYSSRSIDKKKENKNILCEKVGLKYDPSIPIIGMVSRLVHQKGFDLIIDAIPDIVNLGVYFIILGQGVLEFENKLKKLQKKYPEQLVVKIELNNSLAHLIEAGADMFLMPSYFEPCGLNQLYSMKYGTIPIVRKTGGLADTVFDYSNDNKKGTGFVFTEYNSNAMLDAVKDAIDLYKNYPSSWKKLAVRSMKKDFSWDISCKKYNRLYQKLIDTKR